jgi:hypothetical protein
VGSVLRLRLNRWTANEAAGGTPAAQPVRSPAAASGARAGPPAAPGAGTGSAAAAGGRVPQFPQMFALVHGLLPPAALRQGERPWRVEFHGEGGTDAGGLSAEALTSAIEDLMDFGAGVPAPPPSPEPAGARADGAGLGGTGAAVAGRAVNVQLFVATPNGRLAAGSDRDCLLPNPALFPTTASAHGLATPGASIAAGVPPASRLAAAHRLVFLGRLMGSAMRMGFALPLRLPPALWRLILRAGGGPGAVPTSLTLAELATVDDRLASTLVRAQAVAAAAAAGATPDDAAAAAALAGLVHAIPALDPAAPVLQLAPGGAALTVTPANAAAFVAAALAARTAELAEGAALLAHGLAAVVPLPLLCLLTPAGLELRVCGRPGIDVDALRAHTQYEGYGPDHPVVARFWEVLRAMTPAEQESVMRFVYARRRLPAAAARWSHAFVIARMGRDHPDSSLPAGHSCFMRVDLPAYSSAAVLRERLLFACANSIEYDLDGGARGPAG